MPERSNAKEASIRKLTNEQREKFDALPLSLRDKSLILSTFAGIKPVSELGMDIFIAGTASSTTWEATPEELRAIHSIESFCRDLGMHTALVKNRSYSDDPEWEFEWSESRTLVIGNTLTDVERAAKLFSLENRNELYDREIGELLGFPKTAIDAFEKTPFDTASSEWEAFRISPEDLKSIEREEWMAFRCFVLSNKHWREEIETIKRWGAAIKELHPDFYKQVVEEYFAGLDWVRPPGFVPPQPKRPGRAVVR